MAIKIEKVPVNKSQHRDRDFAQFVTAMRDLKVGESFVHPMQSHHRLVVTILQQLYERQYITRREEGTRGHRIGRIA
jgi:hypothetical protein